MQIINTIAGFRGLRSEWQDRNLAVSLVPTMGALHRGHLSLIEKAGSLADRLTVSIFVNPTQFGPNEDFQRYPKPLEEDLQLLEKLGVHAVFVPEALEIYPPGYKTFVTVEDLSQKLCGISRPGHFRGVATVVLKLLNIIQPKLAVFGQKDAQQTFIIRRMVRDLAVDVRIVICPTVREPDGLALSSRNRYLSVEERKAATILYRCLKSAKRAVAGGESRAAVLLEEIHQQLATEPLARLDYAEIVNGEDLSTVELIQEEVLLAMAVFIGKTRLIDNAILGASGDGKLPSGP